MPNTTKKKRQSQANKEITSQITQAPNSVASEAKHETSAGKFKLEILLSIANLFLTAIVGIVIALYIQYRNETLQVSLIKLQNQIESESQNANIYLSKESEEDPYKIRPIFSDITLTNNGVATAKDLRIAICINPYGKHTTLEKPDQFSLLISNPSLEHTVKNIRSDCRVIPDYPVTTAEDSFLINIDSLPPNQSILIRIGAKDYVSFNLGAIEKESYIVIPKKLIPANSDLPIDKHIQSALYTYLFDNIALAEFYITASCDNCVVHQQISTAIWGINGTWEWKDIQIISETDEYVEAKFIFALSHMFPKDYEYEKYSRLLSKDPPLYFIVLTSPEGEGGGALLDVSKKEYDVFKTK